MPLGSALAFLPDSLPFALGPRTVDSEYNGAYSRYVPGTYAAVLAHEKQLKAGKASKRNHAEVVKVTFDPARSIWIRSSHASGKATIRRRATARATTSAATTAVRSTPAAPHKSRSRNTPARPISSAQGRRPRAITTEIAALKAYFKAEDYHQDYLEKNPNGYCGLGGTGVQYAGLTPSAKAAQSSPPPSCWTPGTEFEPPADRVRSRGLRILRAVQDRDARRLEVGSRRLPAP